VVADEPSEREAKLVHFLRRDRGKNKSFPAREGEKGAKRAELSYRVIARSDRYFLLEVEPGTGRHHQIRAQLAAIGSPIKGDLKYGSPRSDTGGGIHLHARRVVFEHPVKKELVSVVAPVPDERLWRVVEALV
jgi:23S rRNA pseudouridine1911/1915/1917 synthase